jgi:hypothetical protein
VQAVRRLYTRNRLVPGTAFVARAAQGGGDPHYLVLVGLGVAAEKDMVPVVAQEDQRLHLDLGFSGATLYPRA